MATHAAELLAKAIVDLDMGIPKSCLRIFAVCKIKVLEHKGFALRAIAGLKLETAADSVDFTCCVRRWSMSRNVGSFSDRVAWSSFSAR